MNSEIVGSALLDGLTRLASQAAAAILAIREPALTKRDKADLSPVTAADQAAEAVVLDGLSQLLPGVPVVSEEAGVVRATGTLGERFVLVDPLDGTREFLAGETDYTVNIALVSDGVPVAGVIAAPALGTMWRGIVGLGAERLQLKPGADLDAARDRTAIRCRPRPAQRPVAVVSRFHRDAATDAFLDRMPGIERITCGSSIKFCRLAEGAADIYARMTSISEWDVAAGHALVVAAGGAMAAMDGKPLPYGRAGFRVPAFLATGDRAPLEI